MKHQETIEKINGLFGAELSNIKELELNSILNESENELEEALKESDSELNDANTKIDAFEEDVYDLECKIEDLEDAEDQGFNLALAVNCQKLELLKDKGLDNIPLNNLESFLNGLS